MGKKYIEFQIDNGLNDFIDCVWKESYSSNEENRNSPFLVVPDNTVELVFTSNSINRKIESKSKSCLVKSHLSGLKTLPQKLKIEGDVLLSIRFKPYGLYRFTKLDLNTTINESIFPEDIFGKDILKLEESLFNCKNESYQISLIESFFMKKVIKTNREEDKVFDFFVQKIISQNGNVNIEELSNSKNISKKTIERKFLSKLGVSPKKYCRIVRIFNALKIPENHSTYKLSSIAFDNGFYDQAHFTKEVKHFTGMTPKEYFELDRSIQTNIFLS